MTRAALRANQKQRQAWRSITSASRQSAGQRVAVRRLRLRTALAAELAMSGRTRRTTIGAKRRRVGDHGFARWCARVG